MLLDGQMNRERNPSLWLGKSRKDRTRTAVIEKSRLNSYSIAPHLCLSCIEEITFSVVGGLTDCYCPNSSSSYFCWG